MKMDYKRITLIIFATLVFVISTKSYSHGGMGDDALIDVTTYPPISEDIKALENYSGAAMSAGKRLVERGDEILSAAHDVLSDPDSPFQQRMQLITVLGEIGDTSSINVIIKSAERNTNNRFLYQNALLALAQFEQTNEVTAFVNQQLESEKRDPLIQRSALAYYAQKPTSEAEKWVKKYTAEAINPDVRYAALYLGGMMGIDSVKSDIIQLLRNKQNNAREYYLLLGLAEITSPDEFDRIINSLDLRSGNINRVREYNLFRKGHALEKEQLADEFIKNGDAIQKRAAVDYLINKKDAKALVKNWQAGDDYVRAAVKRAGYSINVDEHDVRFAVLEKNNTLSIWNYTVFALFAAGFLLLVRIIRSER